MSESDTKPSNANWKAPFFVIWTGQAFSLVGSMLVQFALVWWLTKTTGSGVVLATASLVGMLPQVIIGPFAGTLVDRWNRRLTMIVADSLVALATLLLALLFATGSVQVWHIYALMFVRSVAGGFHWMAMRTSTSLMVPKEHLARIQGLNSMLGGSLNIVSAPLGALVMDLLPMQGVLAIDVSTAFLAVGSLLFVSIPQPARIANGASASQPSFWADFRAGFKYVASWPALLMILGMAMLVNFLLTPASSLMPLLVRNHFNGQAFQFAWMESAWGIGVIAGGLLLSVWGGFKNRMYTTMTGLVGIGAGSLLIGFAPAWAYPLALAGMLVVGLSNPITNGPLLAIVQEYVEPDMQGRVFSLIDSAATSMAPIGLALAGPLSDILGVQSWFIVGGLITVLMAVVGVNIPSLIHFDKGRPEHQPVFEENTVGISISLGD